MHLFDTPPYNYDILSIMSLIAIDRSLHLYLVTNFSFPVKLCWLYVYVNFEVAVEEKNIDEKDQ